MLKHQKVWKYYERGCRYLALFGIEKFDSIYDRIRYLIIVKSAIIYTVSQYATVKVDLYDSLSLEKRMTLRNAIILVKLIWNKDKHISYYNIFLDKASSELPKK